MPSATSFSAGQIARQILLLRRRRVLLDSDLAALYGVPTKSFNQAVRRNVARFPDDFRFQLTALEWSSLRSQFVTLNAGRGQHRKYLSFVFTEHGAIMAASVLNSPRAVDMSVYVVRAFVKLREMLASNAELLRKLEALERSVAALDASTQHRFEEVYDAIRALMTPPTPTSRPIGFTADLDDD
ncbi:MAG: ORF6N domain-containing protein [Gammaproteobacteria bacterium]|nr:ORF6N domain-containing protein [Gammaproteobacteria bacterium]